MIAWAKVRRFLKSTRPERQVRLIKRLAQFSYGTVHRKNLSKLAVYFGTDKQGPADTPGSHRYARHYERHLRSLRRQEVRILEIGIGGYDNPRAGGGSLRMWKAYFRRGLIFGIDVHDKTYHEQPRIKTFQGSQANADFLRGVVADMGGVDIVIDDGSHYNADVIASFETLFPLLSANGIYVVEDTHTSYWSEVAGERWGGSSDVNAPGTSMNFFKAMIDGLDFEDFALAEFEPTYFDRHVIAMHFYHNLVFVCKGLNGEGGSRKLGPRTWAQPDE